MAVADRRHDAMRSVRRDYFAASETAAENECGIACDSSRSGALTVTVLVSRGAPLRLHCSQPAKATISQPCVGGFPAKRAREMFRIDSRVQRSTFTTVGRSSSRLFSLDDSDRLHRDRAEGIGLLTRGICPNDLKTPGPGRSASGAHGASSIQQWFINTVVHLMKGAMNGAPVRPRKTPKIL
jgi:hypothetical protein